ncbi:MAG: ABC transporter permease subunit [Alphaproteobacteria bacterium]|nr:ABC transporter permease subunit [Alphaproteobacteria bacterium]
MRRVLAARALSLAFTLIAASAAIFILVDVAPGDPAAFMMGLNADPQSVAALRAELGLDQPALQRYFSWIIGVAHGDFGLSYTYRVPVGELIWERAQVSFPLTLIALGLSTAFATTAALFAVHQRGRWPEQFIMGGAQLGLAIPNFWLAIVLALIFSAGLGWFSAGGFPGWDAGFFTALNALVLPAIALALPQAAIMTRVLRTAMLEAMGEDFVRTARAKGASRWRALTRHVLPNALIPSLTILGLQFSFLLAGAVIVENVFYLPGLGRLILQAVNQRDLIVVRGVVLVLVAISVLVAFAVDFLHALADPRLRRAAQPA